MSDKITLREITKLKDVIDAYLIEKKTIIAEALALITSVNVMYFVEALHQGVSKNEQEKMVDDYLAQFKVSTKKLLKCLEEGEKD
jgi:hypothetical protein